MPRVNPTKKIKPLDFKPSSNDIDKAMTRVSKKTKSSNAKKRGSWKQGYFVPTNPDKCLNNSR